MRPAALEFARGKSSTQFVRYGGNMKIRTCALTFVLCLLAAAVSFAADDPQLGTWKLNETKSKLTPGLPHNNTVVYEAAGDSIKVTIDGTTADGKPTHSEWTGKVDGKDYPVTGDPTSDTRSYKKIDDRTLAFAGKKGDKVTISGRVTVSADGKTRTVTVNTTDASGKKVKGSAVYDKQS
jgi:hypothetical protein